MRRHLLFASALIAAATLLLIWGLVPGILGRGNHETPVVGLIQSTDIGLHAATVKQGAKLAAWELKADLVVAAPSHTEDAAGAQLEIVRRQIAQGVSALLLVPAGDAVAAEAQALAREANVPLVLLDAGAQNGVRYVGTDHRASGAQAMRALIERADGDVRLLVLTAPDEEGVCAQRLYGAEQAMRDMPEVERLGTRLCLDVDEAETIVREALARDPGINALLGLNGALSEGAARALTALDRAGDVCLVGFDCDQTRVTYLQSGAVRATVLRTPLNIGYLGLTRALEDGPDIFTPSYVVDRTNMLDPSYVKLVFPLVQ